MIKYQPFLTSVESGTKHYNSPFFYPGNVSISKWSLDSKQKLIDGKFLRVGTGLDNQGHWYHIFINNILHIHV
jgi:hypothetical protein